MTDNSDELHFDLAERGGQHRLRSILEVGTWIERELEAWRWMADEGPDRLHLWNHLNSRLSWLGDVVRQGLNRGEPLSQQGHHFRQVFGDNSEAVLHSQSDTGRIVFDIRESVGARSAFAAYGLAAKRVGFDQLRDPVEIRGALLISMPAMIGAEGLQKRLTQERRNLRDRADRLIQSLEEERQQRQFQYENELVRGRKAALTVVRRRFTRWARRFAEGEAETKEITETFKATQQSTLEEFDALKATFLETMRLKAPATYWSDKAKKHRKAETWAMLRLVGFFPAALVGLGFVFWQVGTELLRLPPEGNVTPLFVVASAGLATLAGVIFWVGRLLTKLYLSEHHLRIDAEEREIMTTTYLALTKDAAASDADRGIILAALFRSAPDGIVKDDGSVDVGLASLVSKLGVPSR